MTIGIDASRIAKREKTGVEWYAYNLLNAMRALPCVHTFRLYTREGVPFELPQHWETRKIPWPLPSLWTQGGLSIEMLTNAPDVLFVPSSALPLVLPRKSVTTIHDVGFLDERAYRSRRELAYLNWATCFAVRHATRIIAVSEFTKSQLIERFAARSENITTAHLASVPPPAQSEAEVRAIVRGLRIERPYLLFVSRIDSRKNVPLLVEAFRQLRERKLFDGDLVLAGPVGFDGAGILDALRQGSYHDSIHALGWISEHAKYALLRGAHSFVFPSLYEGFGIAVLEAQSVGTPVICSDTTCLPEVAGDGALLVDPRSVESLVQACARVLRDSALRNELITKGLANVARFSWEKSAEETLAVFDSL